MLLTYLGVYTILLIIIWSFFIVAKIHLYKFKNFSESIEKVTKYLLFFLLFLSVLGYLIIIFGISGGKEVKIQDYKEVNEVYF